MRLTDAIIVLTAALGALAALVLWLWGASADWTSTAVAVSLGLGLIAVGLMVRAGVRNRQCRRLREMRDSALW